MKLNFRQVCLFWGVMDVSYIGRFIWLNLEQGRTPLVDDIISFTSLYPEYGGGFWMVLMFSLSLLLNISIVFTSILLLTGWENVRYLVFAQTPFRLLLTIPSIFFCGWLLSKLNITDSVVFIMVLVLSEVFKVASFILVKKTDDLSKIEDWM